MSEPFIIHLGAAQILSKAELQEISYEPMLTKEFSTLSDAIAFFNLIESGALFYNRTRVAIKEEFRTPFDETKYFALFVNPLYKDLIPKLSIFNNEN